MIDYNVLRRAADHIESHLESFDIRDWGNRTSCGTTACVAGHILWHHDPERFELVCTYSSSTISDEAALLLEPTDTQFNVIDHFFYGGGLPFDIINDNRDKVPTALRWMADNESLSWIDAAEAVGFRCL